MPGNKYMYIGFFSIILFSLPYLILTLCLKWSIFNPLGFLNGLHLASSRSKNTKNLTIFSPMQENQ